MENFKPVSVSKGGFAFCRYTVAIMVWLAIILKNKWWLLAVCIIMTLSYVLKIRKAPLVVLYNKTIDKIKNSGTEMLNENGMRFAHAVGAIMSGIAFILWTYADYKIAMIFTVFLAIMKTSSALGRCSALKLYNCMKGGNCCRIGKYMRKHAK